MNTGVTLNNLSIDQAQHLLAIDTATEHCSAALFTRGRVLSRAQVAPRGHADLILPMVKSLLAEAGIGFAELPAIAFGRGPGAFTGVRLAIGVAQGLAFAWQLPLLPVSNLAVVAQQAVGRYAIGTRVLVCMDARMGEVYTASFELSAAGLIGCSAEQVCAPERVPDAAADLCLGTGFAAYPELAARFAAATIDATALPHASEVLALAQADWLVGKALPADQVLPVYLRDQVTHQKTATKT